MVKTTLRRKSIFGAYSSEGESVTIIMVGSMTSGSQGAEAVAENLNPNLIDEHGTRGGSSVGKVWALETSKPTTPSDTPPPTGPFLMILTKHFHQLKTKHSHT